MSRARGPRKNVGSGTVLLWFIMFAVIGGAVAEFVGPFKGWVEPASEQARELITKVMKKAREAQKGEEVAANKKSEKTVIAPKVKLEAKRSGLVLPIMDTVATAAMGQLPRTGECTPVYLCMTEAPVPVKKPTQEAKVGTPAVADVDQIKVIKPKKAEKLTIAPNSEDEYQIMYEKFLKEEREKGEKKPIVGKTYRYRLKTGTLVSGRLVVLSRDLAVLKTSPTSDITLTPDKLTQQSALHLFPEIYARKRALARLDKEMEKRLPAAGPSEPVASTPAVAAATKPITTESPKPNTTASINVGSGKGELILRPKLSPLKQYDTTYAKTPAMLGRPVTNFANWLKYQSNRSGGAIATKLYAKDHGREAVLYAEMSRFYQAQKYSTRSLVCEQLWHMWARQCRETGVTRKLNYAHIVLVDAKGRIIGGSKVQDASDTWVKQ